MGWFRQFSSPDDAAAVDACEATVINGAPYDAGAVGIAEKTPIRVDEFDTAIPDAPNGGPVTQLLLQVAAARSVI